MSTYNISSGFAAWDLQWFRPLFTRNWRWKQNYCQYFKHFFSPVFEHSILCLYIYTWWWFGTGSSCSDYRIAFWGEPTVLTGVPVYCLFEDLGRKRNLLLHCLQRLITNSHFLVLLKVLYVCTFRMLTHVVGLQTAVNVMMAAVRWHWHRHHVLLRRKY